MSSTQEVGDIFGQGRGSAQAMLRSPTVLILCVGLWGMNLFFYRLFGIDYRYVLNYDLVEIEKEEREKKQGNSNTGNTSTSSNTNSTSRSSGRRRSDGYAETSSSEDHANHMSSPHPHHHDLELLESPNGSDGSTSKSPKRLPRTVALASESGIGLPSLAPQLDVGAAILWYKLVLFSVTLLFLLHTSTHYWMDHLHRSSIGAVFFFYLTMVVYIFVPLRQNVWLRRAFVIVLKRTWALIHPRCSCIFLAGTSMVPRRVPFVDVFFADAMCSLSKVFFDWGMLAHQAVHYPHPVPAATHNIVIPSLCAALPYLIRARQCLIMFTVGKLTRCPKKHHHLMNAFKYSTSMYPLILSAYLKTFSEQDDTKRWETTLTVLLIINASYSLYWDIVMDWGMMQDPYKVAVTACTVGVAPTYHHHHHHSNSCHQVCLRPSLRFGLTLTVLIVVADSFLRFSWLLKFVPKLFPSHDSFVLCTQFLEVFRRAIWNLLRVEWEHIKQQKHASSSVSNSSPSKTNGNTAADALPEQGGLLGSPSPASLNGDPEDLNDSSLVEMKILR